MFSKPGLLNRNETVVRRDVRPVLSGSSPATDTDKAATPPVAAARPEPAPAPVVTEIIAPPAANDMGARLIVGPDVKLRGAEILDCDTLVVEGRVEATMDSRVVRIAEAGSFVGKVSIDVAEIHGRFEGELTARAQLIIHSTGRVSGKIRYGKLVIDEGGELCGEISALGSDTATSPAKSRSETPLPLVVAG
ncbi:MAG: polymer-forming cytoskeletal protein [Dechloromonas sp.]|jgi:cytoskeletal protein CcmA (bactofilin family)|nr:polymer-forming cytoskeletal protein [Dechloromonas sp.]